MASKSAQQEPEKAEVIEEVLDSLDTTVDRLKALYEQYFLGIQKQPPTFVHAECERKLRDVGQIMIRNTALRYRLATLQQKFGAYNAYWRRTLRLIESGKYVRNLQKISRQAAMTGEAIPEEILAAMPKRMREQVRRDREAALALAARRQGNDFNEEDLLTLAPEEPEEPELIYDEDTGRHEQVRSPKQPYVLDVEDAELDYEAFFADLERTGDTAPPPMAPTPAGPAPLRAATLGGPRTPTSAPVAPRGAGQPVPSTLAGQSARARPGQQPRPAGQPPQAARPGQPDAGQLRPGQIPRPGAGQPDAQAARPGQPGQIPRPGAGQPQAARPGQPGQTSPIPHSGLPAIPRPGQTLAPSQVTRPNPVAAGASSARPVAPVETMSGPFQREAQQRPARPAPPEGAPLRPPPGMTDADVNALYAKYIKAKEAVGEVAGPGAYGKLLKTINAQAPKIMQEYKAKGVDFSVVVKDNQVIIRAKPKV